MNKKGKVFGVNVLDLVILLFVVAAAVFVMLKGNFIEKVKVTSNDAKIEYVVMLESVREYTYNAIYVGDPIFDDETDAQIGVVTKVEMKPYYDIIEKSDGTVVSALVPERYKLLITAEGDGKVTDDGYMINGNRLVAPNGSIKVATTRVCSNGKFVSVRQIQAQ
ncbi:DUF4330 domain-containing protein [Feifania hominis]|uniref:DUF4330 domain-containing protein n=1 Tax=Feifania hominis TaxID=2763660 RepID=A0A926HTR9_9FIRM|nr:DUF4330 domain-containing protein [Feifania hominis]MBC8535175.1 DUF4330 domain-containing protein [Feifania hominis]